MWPICASATTPGRVHWCCPQRQWWRVRGTGAAALVADDTLLAVSWSSPSCDSCVAGVSEASASIQSSEKKIFNPKQHFRIINNISTYMRRWYRCIHIWRHRRTRWIWHFGCSFCCAFLFLNTIILYFCSCCWRACELKPTHPYTPTHMQAHSLTHTNTHAHMHACTRNRHTHGCVGVNVNRVRYTRNQMQICVHSANNKSVHVQAHHTRILVLNRFSCLSIC